MNATKTKKLTDEQLAMEVKQGNSPAMGELYSRYYLLVFNKCLSFSKNADDANDMAQDVMIRVFEKLRSFKGEAKFSTWLYAVTFNFCTDRARRAKGKFFSSLEVHHDLVDQSEAALEEALALGWKEQSASRALAQMEAEDQQLLLMKYEQNKSIQELQSIYGLSASAVKMRLLRARGKAMEAYQVSVTVAA
jgi:RNA polymerase sigma-70 factor (ECF subfamily)